MKILSHIESFAYNRINQNILYKFLVGLFLLAGLLLLSSCSADKFIAEDELMLQKISVVSDDPNVDVSDLKNYISQQTNSKWLSSFKVPLGVYSMAGRDTTKWLNRFLLKNGEAPVILDSAQTATTILSMEKAEQNKGYLDAKVYTENIVKGKKVKLVYHVNPGEPYIIRGLSINIEDKHIDSIITAEFTPNIIKNNIFNVNNLNDERKRITSFLQDRGYYLFNKEFIHYDVDSSFVDKAVFIKMNISQYRKNNYTAYTDHPCFTIDSVRFSAPTGETLSLRPTVLEMNTAITPGSKYSATDLLKTYNNFSRLAAVRYTNIHFEEVVHDSLNSQPSTLNSNPSTLNPQLSTLNLLNCNIQLSKARLNSLQFQPEGTNTAGDFGAAASLTYQNRNLFHGSEVLNFTVRGAYEAISGLEGYQNSDYQEYGVEMGISFPQLLFPWVSREFKKRSSATSELNVSYDLQNRPEFHRRLFNAVWRYRWQNVKKHAQYKIDVLDLNYISMPWISNTFKHDYLDSVSNRNAILKYNYEDLFIMKIGFGYTWSKAGNTLRLNFETAGNLLDALRRPLKMPQNEDGNYKFLGIAFAQYVKGDAEYTHLIQLGVRNALVLHGRLGIAYPYGNSNVLPYEKRYFSGGANSLRGWSIRSLGPGSYKGKDGRIDFINQTGDIRLDLNAELRAQLFWKFQGAVFVDAGNIWTIRDYPDQPEGQFKFTTFWQQMAANYGIGLRMNFDYFVLRLDMGVKAINPAYNTQDEHFPIIHPNFNRDCQFHFAVGMPF